MSCFICYCDPDLTGNGREVGRVIAKLLSKAGTAENPRESCFCKDTGACFAPGVSAACMDAALHPTSRQPGTFFSWQGSEGGRRAAGGLQAGGSGVKQTTGKRKHVFPAWDRAGAHLHCFQTLRSLPLGSFSLHEQSNHFLKNSAATQKRNISSYGKALGDLRRDLSEQGPVKITSVLH